jgi:hypothetical protein
MRQGVKTVEKIFHSQVFATPACFGTAIAFQRNARRFEFELTNFFWGHDMFRFCSSWRGAALWVMASLMASVASAQTVYYNEVARFTLSSGRPAGFGSNPSAIAWDGSKMFIAGLNNLGTTASVGIVEVTNASSTGVNAATFGALFGTFASTGSTRGYSGLDISGSTIAAAYDSGASIADGIAAYDTAGTRLWGISARGSSGVAFDPGFGNPAVDSGVAWTSIGSGRRSLQNSATGANIYTSSTGMIINAASGDTGTGTNWRDMAFDPLTGDLYPRRSNGILKDTRTGGNSVSPIQEILPAQTIANFVSGQNIAFMGQNPLLANAVIYNDRATTANGQVFTNVIKTRDTTTFAELTPTFQFLNGFTPNTSNGYYDFSYDPGSNTVAVLDFSNNTAHVFSVSAVPEPATWALLGTIGIGAGLASIRRGWKQRIRS